MLAVNFRPDSQTIGSLNSVAVKRQVLASICIYIYIYIPPGGFGKPSPVFGGKNKFLPEDLVDNSLRGP